MTRRVELSDVPTGLTSPEGFQQLFKFAFSLGNRGLPPTVMLLAPDGDPSDWSDTFLVDLGLALGLVTRRTDVVARLSDTEFVCLLVDCNTSGGIVAADRIRASMEEFTARTGVTLSAGISTYAKWMESGDTLMAGARKALEVAQVAGGDRTELSAAGPPPATE